MIDSLKGVDATKALLLSSSEEWYSLGQVGGTTFSDNIEDVTDAITSLMLIRIIAMNKSADYDDLSTTSIATIVVNTGNGAWPADVVSSSTIEQTRNYVAFILKSYQDVPFHNFGHAYHVVLSANKFLDYILLTDANKNDSRRRPPATFGMRTDPTALLALLFAALVHDAGHIGITNRQRVLEQDEMAIRYNDESIHENYALSLAFGELLKADYGEMRRAMFPSDEHYRYFRKLVVDSVLATDLASPSRIQISRSKFQEAFQEEGEEVLMWNNNNNDDDDLGRRLSMSSAISNPRAPKVNGLISTTIPAASSPHKNSRRGSTQSVSSVISDISTDSYALMRQQGRQHERLLSMRRMSNQSVDSFVSDYDSVHPGSHGSGKKKRNISRNLSSDSNNDDSMLGYVEKAMKGQPIRRHSSMGSNRRSSPVGSLNGEDLHPPAARRQSLNDSGSGESSFGESLMAAESIDLAQKRNKGQGLSRNRLDHPKALLPGAKYLGIGGGDGNDGEDDELSLTPPSSDDEMEGVIITGASGKDTFSPGSGRKMTRRRSSVANRRGSTSSTAVFNIEEEDPNNMNDSAPDLAVEIEAKHHSAATLPQELGIRRSIDLSGESIDEYSVRDSITVCSMPPELLDQPDADADEPDEFKTSVVIELLLRAADISYWFQSDKLFLKYSGNLLQELVNAHKADRGVDPRPKWVQNQLNMAQQYVAVIALQLQRTGVFGRNFDFWFPLPEDDFSGEWRFPSHIIVKPLTAVR